jgi:hypothetical protein
MNRLLSGLAFLAVLALAAPVSAQAPIERSVAGASRSSAQGWIEPAPATAEKSASRPMRHRRHYARHLRGHDSRWRSPADRMANRLNRQELMGEGRYGAARSYSGGYGPRPYSASGY